MKKAKWYLILVCLALCLTACSANRRCESCNQTIPADSAYCMYCGTVQSSVGNNELDGNATKNYTILDKGTCNQNVYWEIRSDGTLYIGGTGTTPNYKARGVDGEIAPWRASAISDEIKTVIVGDGISAIGEYAFCGMRLDAMYIGHNVIAYEHSFNYFYAENIYLPTSLKDIYYLLCDGRATQGAIINVFYEGTQQQWDEEQNQWLLSYYESVDGLSITCDCTYTCE